MEIVNHLLYNQGKQVTFKQTPNHGGALNPKYLLIHYDASNNATGAISWMLSPTSKVSAHLHIDREGKIVQLAKFNQVCYHAGKSTWDGLNGLNNYSIGIELQNNGVQDYTAIQLAVCLQVSKSLVSHYKLKDVLGHEQVSPKRKIDPGKKFPMAQFRKDSGIGVCDVTKTTTDLNLREGAGTEFAKLAVLKKDTIVTVKSVSGDWSKVDVVNSNLSGYVASKYLTA